MATRMAPSGGGQPRIIVDCTHTFKTGAGTGIQRVVRRFADGLMAAGQGAGIEVVPVRVDGVRLIPLPTVAGRVAFPRAPSAREEDRASQGTALTALLRAIGHRSNAVRSRRFSQWLDAGPNAPGLARLLRKRNGAAHGDLKLAASDIVLCLDSSWVYDIRTTLEAAGRAGATRVALLCDVLPWTHPRWFTEGTRLWFMGWLRALLPRIEGAITISEVTKSELQSVLAQEGIAPRLPIVAVHLGAELGDDGGAPVRPELATLLAPEAAPAFLTVGTLEPRKNVDFALDIFDHLLARGWNVQWHLAGAPGWLSDATAERIREHAELGSRLHWWTDLDDAELAWLYRHARALVAVSRAEGYGLPLVEARLQGLPVFASDIPVFREILADEGRFLPLSSAALAAAPLEDFLRGALPAAGGSGPTRVAATWQARSGELLGQLLAIHRERRTA